MKLVGEFDDHSLSTTILWAACPLVVNLRGKIRVPNHPGTKTHSSQVWSVFVLQGWNLWEDCVNKLRIATAMAYEAGNFKRTLGSLSISQWLVGSPCAHLDTKVIKKKKKRKKKGPQKPDPFMLYNPCSYVNHRTSFPTCSGQYTYLTMVEPCWHAPDSRATITGEGIHGLAGIESNCESVIWHLEDSSSDMGCS